MEVLTLEDTKTEIGYETCPYGDFDLGRCEQGRLSGVEEIRTGRRAASSSTRASSAWSSIGLSNDSISCVHCEMECIEANEAMVYLILFLVVADELFATFALAKILELWLGFVGVAQLVWIR